MLRGGETLASVTGPQSFYVVVQLPVGDGQPPASIVADVATSSGGATTALLTYQGIIDGSWYYSTNLPVTIADPAPGTWDFTREMGYPTFENRDAVTISHGGAEASFTVFTTWAQQGLYNVQRDLAASRLQIENDIRALDAFESAGQVDEYLEHLDELYRQAKETIGLLPGLTDQERRQLHDHVDQEHSRARDEAEKLRDPAYRDQKRTLLQRRLEYNE
jgi:hypothetical protein